MEASQQPTGPAWMPSGLDADSLREKVRALKERGLGDSPAELAAALRQNFQELKDRSFGASTASGASGSGDAAGATVATPPFEERPELYVGAAFAGGLALAGFLRLISR